MNSIENLSLIMQALSLEMLFKDCNNMDLMNLLKIVIYQNNKIIELLERNKNGEDTNTSR